MALTPGTILGPYEVLSAIGAGGMGEVYKARDTKLDRDVALKILPDAFVNDPERLARFQREAKVLASLNHPNIAAIYGLEESGDSPALVLEYVEGPTLQDRIAKGPIPLDEALPIARQIAEALEAAHEQGIIHRDLKPANVKVKADGTVKVLDFGLAKALGPELSDLDAANSPTMTMTAAATKMGVIMGTAAYMSPEQAKGRQVDKRADIWAFGVVLFEMLTGRQAFGGTDISETLASVLMREIDWTALPTKTPASVRRMLRRCVTRDRKNRLADMSMARLEIDEADAAPETPTGAVTTPVAPPAVWQRPVPLALTALLLVGVSVLVAWNLRTPPPRLVTRFSMVLPAGQQLTTPQGRQTVALSPDGTRVAYITNNELYLRPMNEETATPMRGTDGARGVVFSPDGQWIAFVQGGQLKKVAVTGGAPVTVCEAGNPRGVSWEADDTIFFTSSDGIHRVSADGGTPELVVDTTDAIDNGPAPQVLPGGQALLVALRPPGANFDQAQIVAQRLDTGERHVLLEGGTSPRYVSTGHLVYAQGGTLFAVPFDLDKLEVTGGPVSLVEGVRQSGNTGNAHFSVSQTGSLVYVPGRDTSSLRTLVWVDREGQEEAVAAEPRNYVYPRISPDGTKVALDVRDQENDIWIWDLARETLTRLTFDAGNDQYPTWTPNGERLAFRSPRAGQQFNLYWKAADGTGTVERVTESPDAQIPTAFSQDGTHLIFHANTESFDLRVLGMDGERESQPLITSEFNERNAELSPDDRWVAYESDASGQYEVYVQPFPNVDDGRWQISTDGGRKPLWEPNGRELFYRTPEGAVMVVAVQTEPTFAPGNTELLFEGSYTVSGGGRDYDIAPEGQRFLMIREGRESAESDDPFVGLSRIRVVLNWHQELLERVPVP